MTVPDDFWNLPYPSRREPVLGDAVVATSQPLAVTAGLEMLHAGGNAVDAALSAAIALTVVEPTSNGIGSDLFAIVADGETVTGLNASGRSPAGIDTQRLEQLDQMPSRGWDSVVVPGAVSGWVALAERFGALDLPRIVGPAVRYAEHGFPVGPVTARAWQHAARDLAAEPDFAPFLIDGAAPRAGDRFAFGDQARTLTEIAETAGESFYQGGLAERITTHAERTGGTLSQQDLAEHRADWVDPLQVDFAGASIIELPPNTQGITALIALGILRAAGIDACAVDSPDAAHLQIEATKLALAASAEHVADPAAMRVDTAELLDDTRLAELASRIDPGVAADIAVGPRPGGTVYVCAADSTGLMVSLIQSNYMGFGSGIVVPGTGISLANRGAGYVTTAGHPNVVAPRKRPFSTIIPGFVMRDGNPLMAFGVMGGFMQAQGHVQMVVRSMLWGQNPQAAADAVRWQVAGGRDVLVEEGFAPAVLEDLRARGHRVHVAAPEWFGGAQLVMRLPSGALLGASDWRKEGLAAAV